MSRKLYVGNLSYQTEAAELQQLFEQAGTVEAVKIMKDMATGRIARIRVRRDEHGRGGGEGHLRAECASVRGS